ncbi:MAG TPA: cupredoxin domain-containing protein [Actinomycetota bacterium]|nr:cupredoxin domain-containing protein [Actinomycetota bacterium]
MKRLFIVALFATALVLAAALIPQRRDTGASEGPPSATASASAAASGASPEASSPHQPTAAPSSLQHPAAAPSRAATIPGAKATGQTTGLAPPISLPYVVNDNANVDDAGRGAAFSLDVSATNFHFTPTFIQATPGAQVTVHIANNGTLTHTFTVDAEHIDVVLGKGQNGTATVTVPAAGYVTFYCRFHWGGGMRGAIYAR